MSDTKYSKGLQKMLASSRQELSSTKEGRVAFVLDLIARGFQYKEIKEAVKKEYGLKERAAQYLIADANQVLTDATAGDRLKEYNKTKMRFELIFKMAIEQNNLTAANQALTQLKNLEGLDGVIKTANLNVNAPQVDTSKFSMEELLQLNTILAGKTIEGPTQ